MKATIEITAHGMTHNRTIRSKPGETIATFSARIGREARALLQETEQEKARLRRTAVAVG